MQTGGNRYNIGKIDSENKLNHKIRLLKLKLTKRKLSQQLDETKNAHIHKKTHIQNNVKDVKDVKDVRNIKNIKHNIKQSHIKLHNVSSKHKKIYTKQIGNTNISQLFTIFVYIYIK